MWLGWSRNPHFDRISRHGAKRAPCDTGLLSKLKIAKAAPDYGIEVVTLPIEKNADPHLMALRNWLKVHRQQFDVINTHSSTDAWLVALSCASLRHLPP